MPKISKTAVDAALRREVFETLFSVGDGFTQINDRQFGIILTDLNGHERYVRIGAIVAEEREDCTARELMEREINTYLDKQAEKAEKAAKRAEKAKTDAAKRKGKGE